MFASRAVIYHLGSPAEPAVKRSTLLGWSWERHLTGVPPQLQASLVAYLECAAGPAPDPPCRTWHLDSLISVGS